MYSWPHERILGAQIMAESYNLDSINGFLTCYGGLSDVSLALHRPLHNVGRSTTLWLSEPNPGSTRSYDIFLYGTG